jgi:hypothetical protein
MVGAVNGKKGLIQQLTQATEPVIELAQQVLKIEWERVKRGG